MHMGVGYGVRSVTHACVEVGMGGKSVGNRGEFRRGAVVIID